LLEFEQFGIQIYDNSVGIVELSMQRADDVLAYGNMPPFEASDAALGDTRLEKFFAHWRRCLSQDRWPARAAIDPLEMPRRVLPHLMITQRRGAHREVVRLAGTHIVDHLGYDPSRRDLRELAGDGNFADLCLQLHDEMRQTSMALYAGGRHVSSSFGARRICRRVVCPLSDDGLSIDAMVSCIVFEAEPHAPPISAGGHAVREFTTPIACETVTAA